MRNLGTHHVAARKRRRFAVQGRPAFAAGGAVGEHDDAVVGLPDLDVDFRLGVVVVVDDFLDFFRDYWAGLGGKLVGVVGFVGLVAVAGGEAEGEEEEGQDYQRADEDSDDDPEMEAED